MSQAHDHENSLGRFDHDTTVTSLLYFERRQRPEAFQKAKAEQEELFTIRYLIQTSCLCFYLSFVAYGIILCFVLNVSLHPAHA